MTGFWLGSYVVLWILQVSSVAAIIATMRQVGLLRIELALHPPSETAGRSTMPSVESDGPELGSSMSPMILTTIDGKLLKLPLNRPTLLTFMSAICPGCQKAIKPLNSLADDEARGVQPVVILRAEEETCLAFLAIFELRVPVICDDRRLTMEFSVHRNPFALLYNREGTLVRKAIVEEEAHIQALMRDQSI